MATLTRSIERPSILGPDRHDDDGQLSFGEAAVSLPVRTTPAPVPATQEPLSERLRREREEAAAGATKTSPQRRPSGGLTLDELLVGAWEGLSANRHVSCPVCHGAMQPRRAAGPEAGVTGGACADCGALLS